MCVVKILEEGVRVGDLVGWEEGEGGGGGLGGWFGESGLRERFWCVSR